MTSSAIDLQGHRGARGLHPENTLEGFERALAIGVTTLELDTGITADGEVVVIHDRRLNAEHTRDPQGRWLERDGPLVNRLALAELQRYDVGRIRPGTDYARRFPLQKPIDGARIPRLADLFALAVRLGADRVRFNIETKLDPEQPGDTVAAEPFAHAIVEAIRRAGLSGRATIQSFDWRTLVIVQREAPEIATVYLSAELPGFDTIRRAAGRSPWTAPIAFADHGSVPRMVRAAGGRIWSPHFANADAGAIAEARALGLQVVVWTVNEPADIEAALDRGVDGIISDYPDRVRAAMQRRGLALPPPVP